MYILIVEDDPAIAQTLSFALKKQGFGVSWAANITEALVYVRTLPNLDAIVMDIGLPDGTGLHLCQQIRFGNHHACVPIMFLSAKDDEVDKLVGLEIGADDYMTKPFSPKELIARLNAIWRRQGMEKTNHQSSKTKPNDFQKTLSSGTWRYNSANYSLFFNDIALTLSKTELAIMLTLLANPAQVFSREQLLCAISDHPEHRLVRTIDAHIKSLRQKLTDVSQDTIIHTHRGLGYSLAE